MGMRAERKYHSQFNPYGKRDDEDDYASKQPVANLTIKNPISYDKTVNPNPKKFEILLTEKIGDFLIAKIKYEDCTNFEGIKLLVFKNMTIKQLAERKEIDPHFFDSDEAPIARFRPNEDGVRLARKICQ